MEQDWSTSSADRERAVTTGFSLLVYPRKRGLPDVVKLVLFVVLFTLPHWTLVLIATLSHHAQTHSVAAGKAPEPTPLSGAFVEWLMFGYIVFVTWLVSRGEKRGVIDYGLRDSALLKRIGAGALWGVICMSLLIALLRFSGYLGFDGFTTHGVSALAYGIGWAFMFLGVALFEEFFFRGYLQVLLARCFAGLYGAVNKRGVNRDAFGFWAAAVAISFGFGFVHGANPGESPIGLLAAGLAGLTFAYSLWRTGSLWWAIGIHAAWDWAQSFVFGVADSGLLIREHFLRSHPVGPVWLSGGLTGPEGSVFVLPVLLVIVVVIRMTLPAARAMNERVALQNPEAQTINSANA